MKNFVKNVNFRKGLTMKRFNGHLRMTYNTNTKKIEIDPDRFICLLVTYKQISEDVRLRMIKEIKQLARED